MSLISGTTLQLLRREWWSVGERVHTTGVNKDERGAAYLRASAAAEIIHALLTELKVRQNGADSAERAALVLNTAEEQTNLLAEAALQESPWIHLRIRRIDPQASWKGGHLLLDIEDEQMAAVDAAQLWAESCGYDDIADTIGRTIGGDPPLSGITCFINVPHGLLIFGTWPWAPRTTS